MGESHDSPQASPCPHPLIALLAGVAITFSAALLLKMWFPRLAPLLFIAVSATGFKRCSPIMIRSRGGDSELSEMSPDPIYYFHNSIPAVSQRSSHKVSGGGWNELSKASITSTFVIRFRVQLHSASEWIRYGGTEPGTASESCGA